MIEILNFINSELDKANIPYEFGEWRSAVTYPYFVGAFTESDYRFEDNCSVGTFTLDGWSCSSMLELLTVNEKIKALFQDLQTVQDNKAFYIRYGGAIPVPTGEEGLYRITITLFTYEWEGE